MSIPAGPIEDVPRRGLLGAAQRALTLCNAVLAFASGLALAAAACVLTWEVIGRYFLAIPSDWQDELAILLLIGATFASAAWCQARRFHVGIDALAALLPARANRLRQRIADAAGTLFCGYFAWKCWGMLVETWVEDETTSSAWGSPLWIPYGAMCLGMALLSLQLLLQALAGPQIRPLAASAAA